MIFKNSSFKYLSLIKKKTIFVINKNNIYEKKPLFKYYQININNFYLLFFAKLFFLNNLSFNSSLVHFEFKNFFSLQYKKILILNNTSYFNH